MTIETHALGSAIALARGEGRVICADFYEKLSLPQLALSVNLDPTPSNYRECSPEEGRFIVSRVISHGLVDEASLVPAGEAESFANAFLERFSNHKPVCYTNGEFLFFGNDSYLGRWKQVTPEIMSSGVLVVGNLCSGALWIADLIPQERAEEGEP